MRVFYFKEDIRNVTEFYYNIIFDALKLNKVEILCLDDTKYSSIKKVSRTDYIMVTNLRTFFKLYFIGYRNFIYWFQGITPEELMMMTGSKARYYLYSWIEKLALKKIKYRIGVSKYLFNHFENKYNISIPLDSVFVMPCFNSDFNRNNFFTEDKYDKNVFTFAGGMQVWQGFDMIAQAYKIIEDKYNDTFFKVFSKDIEQAKNILVKYNIKNFSVDCVSQEKMSDALADCKFGFLLRDDNVINNVATPTKLATYLGNGIIPIMTPSVFAFSDLSKQYHYLCCSDISGITNSIKPYIENKIQAKEVYFEYQRLFEDYYNRNYYVEGLRHFLTI